MLPHFFVVRNRAVVSPNGECCEAKGIWGKKAETKSGKCFIEVRLLRVVIATSSSVFMLNRSLSPGRYCKYLQP